MRRGTYRGGTVDYAAVGATQASDLLQYPPERSIPAEESWRIGSGEERFRIAGDLLFSWHAQRDARLHLKDIRPSAEPQYTGVSFDDEGNALTPARMDAEPRYDSDGIPYVRAGTTLRISGRVEGMRADAEVRVVFVVDEARRMGFGLGTVRGSVVSGEESFMIDWLANDEVRFTVRAFDAPVSLLYRVLPWLVRRRRRALFTRYLRAISPLYTAAD